MHRKVAVAIAAALALTVASCGGSETTTLTRAALVRRVETACREAQAAAARASSSDPITGLRAAQKRLVEKLDGLEGSGSAKADFDTYKEAARGRSDLIERIASASRAERQRVLRAVAREAEQLGRRLETAATRLGLTSCA